jgi:membrane-associated phospholipid phosphatase
MVLGAIAILMGTKDELFLFFNGQHTEFLDAIMPYVTWMGEGIAITIILMLLLGFKSFRNRWYFVAAAACTILSSLLTQGIKTAVAAPRPLSYFTDNSIVHILPEWKHYTSRSFPSGHTCGAFAMFFLLSCLLPERYRKFAVVFFFLALSVGYSRIYLGAHFFADVYAGSLVGVGFSAIMLMVMRRYQPVFFRKKKDQG